MGAVASQIIAMAANLVLSQIYQPEQFGALGIFISLSAFISVVASARFDQAIMLPIQREDASELAVISILLACATAMGVWAIVGCFQPEILKALGAPTLKGWILLLPLSIAAAATIQSMTIWTMRQKRFSTVSVTRVGQSTLSAIGQLAGGAYQYAGGLICGSIGGQVAGVTAFGAAITCYRDLRFTRPRWRGIPSLMRRFGDMPLHSVPESILSQIQSILPTLVFARMYTLEATGQLLLAQRLVVLPIAFLSQALGPVMFQWIASRHAAQGDLRVPLRFIWTRLVVVALPLSIIFWLFSEQIVKIVLGPRWSECGQIVETMAPYLAAVLVFGPTNSLPIVIRKQHLSLAVAAAALAVKLGAIFACNRAGANYLWMLRAFVAIDIIQIIGLNTWFYCSLRDKSGNN